MDGGLLDVVSGATTTGAKAPDVTDVVLVDGAGADAVGSAQDRERVGDRLVDLAHFRQRTGDCVLEPTWDMADEEQHICLNYTSRHSLTPPYS